MRIACVKALGDLANPENEQLLITATYDKDWVVRSSAVKGLGKINNFVIAFDLHAANRRLAFHFIAKIESFAAGTPFAPRQQFSFVECDFSRGCAGALDCFQIAFIQIEFPHRADFIGTEDGNCQSGSGKKKFFHFILHLRHFSAILFFILKHK